MEASRLPTKMKSMFLASKRPRSSFSTGNAHAWLSRRLRATGRKLEKRMLLVWRKVVGIGRKRPVSHERVLVGCKAAVLDVLLGQSSSLQLRRFVRNGRLLKARIAAGKEQ